MSKSNSKKVVGRQSKNQSVASTTLGVADPVPVALAPVVPSGWVPKSPGRQFSGYRPAQPEIEQAPTVAAELRSSDAIAEQLGASAPSAAAIADALAFAASWSHVLANAEAWAAYVKAQEGKAWKHALTLLEPLRAPFAYASGRSNTLADALPSTARFLALPKERAKRAATTKRSKKKKSASKEEGAAAKDAAKSV